MAEHADKIESSTAGEVADLREELRSLRMLLSASIVLLIVISLCLSAYLMKQGSMARGSATQAEKVIEAAAAKSSEFWIKINEYAKTHPDFAPIVAKYHPHIGATLLVRQK